MSSFASLALSAVLALSARVSASVGPTGTLTLTNGVVSPDGFARDAILINGQTPGPLLTGKKVSDIVFLLRSSILM